MGRVLTMDDILKADFGETKGELAVSYKKTINTKQYESEVIELETKLAVDNNLSGVGRMAVATLLAAQLEYTCYVSLFRKGQISTTDFVARRDELASVCSEACDKYETVTGNDISHIIKL